jgi:hypothetical protein
MSDANITDYLDKLLQLREKHEARRTSPLGKLELVIAEDLLHDLQLHMLQLDMQNKA